MIRAVFDSGVVVSALLFTRGPAARLRAAWGSGRVQALVSRETLSELVRVLAYPKFGLSGGEIEALLAAYLPWTAPVRVPKRLPKALPRCRDEADHMFLALAAAGRAQVLVTGDGDLLDLAGRAPFAIETIAAFLRRLG